MIKLVKQGHDAVQFFQGILYVSWYVIPTFYTVHFQFLMHIINTKQQFIVLYLNSNLYKPGLLNVHMHNLTVDFFFARCMSYTYLHVFVV